MQRYNRTRFSALIILASVVASARADEVPFDPLFRCVNNDTMVIATARFNPAVIAQLQALVGPQMVTPVDRAMVEKFKPILETWGDRRVFLIAGINDMMPGAGGPLLIATVTPGETAAQFRAFAEKLQSQLLDGAKPAFAWQVRLIETKGALFGGEAALIGSNAALARFDAIKPEPRPDLIDPLTKVVESNVPIAVIVAPGPDARRVLREMWPALPAPFDAVSGSLVADRVRQISLTAQLPPQWSAEVAIHTTDDETAKTLASTGQQIVAQFAPLIQSQLPLKGDDFKQMLDIATPEQDGPAVKLTVRHDDAAIAKAVASVISAAAGDARKKAQRMQRMNQFKQMAIAFHNFHDTQKHLPAAAAICDNDGKPLLSWRVAILPYIEQQALFDEFHLDEPWDSEHNSKLLERMPEVFADPERPAHAGKTTFQLPVHPETAFPPMTDMTAERKNFAGRDLYSAPGKSFKDITDGTSQTIMIVEVAPDRAVEWTKPVDWEVDLANPMEGLKQGGREGFISAFCDGSAHFMLFTVEADVLRKFLTRAGGEVIDKAH